MWHQLFSKRQVFSVTVRFVDKVDESCRLQLIQYEYLSPTKASVCEGRQIRDQRIKYTFSIGISLKKMKEESCWSYGMLQMQNRRYVLKYVLELTAIRTK